MSPPPSTSRPSPSSRSRSRSRSPRRSESPPHDPEAWRRIRPYHRHPPIRFVPASDPSTTALPPTVTNARKPTPAEDIAASYLALVGLGPTPTPSPGGGTPDGARTPDVCEICKLPVTGSAAEHERTTAHQAALPHSFPPHPHPRSSVGLKVLEKAGWDPDARVGLGKEGQGLRYPIKAVEKKDRVGVGANPEEVKKAVAKERKLGVKEMQKLEHETRRKRERMRGELMGGVDWSLIDGSEKMDGLR